MIKDLVGFFKKNQIRLRGFTLAEIMAVLVILGVVVAITIPTTVKRTTERQNKTKILRAMADYEKVLSQWYIEEQYNSYISQQGSIKLDPDNELEGLSGAKYKSKYKELSNRRNELIEPIK